MILTVILPSSLPPPRLSLFLPLLLPLFLPVLLLLSFSLSLSPLSLSFSLSLSPLFSLSTPPLPFPPLAFHRQIKGKQDISD